MSEFLKDADGGLIPIVEGKEAGYIPAGHPRAIEIEEQVKRGDVIIAPVIEKPKPPVVRALDVTGLVDLLLRKGVIDQSDIDGELGSVKEK